MHKSLRNLRFSIRPQLQETERPLEMARTLSVHPLTYQELPYNPEYSQYAGRLTTEMVLKAISMGVPILVSRSGFTKSAVHLARKFNLSMIGRFKGKRFMCVSGFERVLL